MKTKRKKRIATSSYRTEGVQRLIDRKQSKFDPKKLRVQLDSPVLSHSVPKDTIRNFRRKLQMDEAKRQAIHERAKDPKKRARILFRVWNERQEKRLSGHKRYVSYARSEHEVRSRSPKPPRILPKDHPICVERRKKRSALFAKKRVGSGKSGPKIRTLTEDSKVICRD